MGETLETPTAELDVADLRKRLEALEALTATMIPAYPGMIAPWAGTAPTALTGEQEVVPSWLLCNGQTVSRTRWPQLFDAVGTKFATGGEAATDFRLPNLVGRAPFGKASSGTLVTVGASGGVTTHTLSTSEMPSHTHGMSGAVAGVNTNAAEAFAINFLSVATSAFFNPGPTDSAGSGGAHQNMPPYQVVEGWLIYAGPRQD